MKCTEEPTKDCNNEDMKACLLCRCNMWCGCRRPEMQAMVRKLWKSDAFYVQNGIVGNCMQWWKYDNCGYTYDIKHARIFTKDELREIHFQQFTVWPKDYIDSLIEFHVDIQLVDYKNKVES